MSSFKKDLQDLLDDCILYSEKAQEATLIDNTSYAAVAQAIEALEATVREIKTDDVLTFSDIKQLAETLNCLVDYDILTKGKYRKWANQHDIFTKPKEHQELLNKVLAIRQEQVEQFIALYNALDRPARKVYQSLTKELKHYTKMLTSANLWQQNVTTFSKLNEQRKELFLEFSDLGISSLKSNISITPADKTVAAQALLVKFVAFKTTVLALPSHFEKIKKSFLKHVCNNHIETLTLALERTTAKFEDPSIQPVPHEAHNYVLKTIAGELFEFPTNNTENEPLISDNDALQGLLGDCYLIASLMALAKKCPDIIRNAITEKKQGNKVTYEVKLYFLDKNDDKKLVPQKVVIDNQFMVKSDKSTAYAAKGDQGELWALVIEKAMAKALGGYKTLAGGNMDWALRMLSGEFPKSNDITQDNNSSGTLQKGTSKEDIIQLLKDSQGKLITIAIRTPKAVNGLFEIRDIETTSTESHYIDFSPYYIYCNHAYVVESIDYAKLDSAGDKDAIITLRNPHNTKEAYKKFPKVSPLLLKHCASKIVVL